MNIFKKLKSIPVILTRYFYPFFNWDYWSHANELGRKNDCLIVGNGPSLKGTLEKHLDFFKKKKIMCVNAFALSPHFLKIKPRFYVFADPGYWARKVGNSLDEERRKTVEVFKKVDWPLTVFMPIAAKSWNPYVEAEKKNKLIKVCYVNSSQGSLPLIPKNVLYKYNLKVPVFQNVLVMSTYLAIHLGARNIYIVGADHSWHETLYVGEDNLLYWRDNHFDDPKEQKLTPIYADTETKTTFTIGNLFSAFARAFNAYEELELYSRYMNSKIYNASEKSYIDSFERYKIKG